MKLKITAIGNSAGVILPKELMARLRVEKGDELYAVETPDGVEPAPAWAERRGRAPTPWSSEAGLEFDADLAWRAPGDKA